MKKHDGLEIIINLSVLLAIAALFALIVIAGFKIRSAPPPVKPTMAEWSEILSQQHATAQAQAEWRRLHKKHGYPGTVIYQPGKTPYYMCGKDKREKCQFL